MARKDQIRAAVEKQDSKDKQISKTTKGKGAHYQTVAEGAGMTAAGRKAYNAKTGGDLKPPQSSGPRHDSFCARSAGWTGERGKAARARWKC